MAANAEKRAKAIAEEEAQPFVVEVLDVGANGKVRHVSFKGTLWVELLLTSRFRLLGKP